MLQISEITQYLNFFKNVLQITTEALGLYQKKMGMPHKLVFLFQVENGLHGISENNEYISMPTIFFNLSPCVWENNGLLNKNQWDDLDIIYQGNCKGNISQFCLYHGYP